MLLHVRWIGDVELQEALEENGRLHVCKGPTSEELEVIVRSWKQLQEVGGSCKELEACWIQDMTLSRMARWWRSRQGSATMDHARLKGELEARARWTVERWWSPSKGMVQMDQGDLEEWVRLRSMDYEGHMKLQSGPYLLWVQAKSGCHVWW